MRATHPTLGRTLAAGAAALAVVASAGAIAVAAVDSAPPEGLVAVGPTSSEHGFPVWYEDPNGVRLEQCLDVEDPYCDPAFLAAEMPDGTQPMSFPDNFPMESFYFSAGSVMDAPGGGRYGLVSALEATWANEAVQDGDQVVFGRVRLDLDLPHAGTYTIRHPFGTDTFTVTDAEAGGFRYVEDITASPQNFTLALQSRISPFLTWDTGMVTAADGSKYVGDPAIEHAVTGSTVVDPDGNPQNYFRVEGPDAGGPGIDVAETPLFNLMGKVSTRSGVVAHKAVVTTGTGGTFLDVFAETDSGDSVSVSGEGIPTTLMVADGSSYFARIPVAGTVPTSVTVTNESDVPASTKNIEVADEVVISRAVYDTEARQLSVAASSSTGGQLSVAGTGAVLTDGTAVLDMAAPPVSVTVRSDQGGSDSAPVTATGGSLSTPFAVTAVVTGPTTAQTGGQVTLDASASLNATDYLWHEPAGQGLGVDGATAAMVSFTAPATPGRYEFWVTATGEAGSDDSDHLVVDVVDALPDPEPEVLQAVVTATPTNPMVGQQVTVSGMDSAFAETYSWSQVSGATVNLPTDTATDRFSFTMPSTQAPIVLQLTVGRGDAGEQSTAQVTITPVVDELAVTFAQLRTDKGEWRIEGTSSIWATNTVRVYQQNADGTRGPELGNAIVSAPVAPATLGDWGVKVRGTARVSGSSRLWIESSRGGLLKDVVYTTRG